MTNWRSVPPAHGAAVYPEPVRIEHAVTDDDPIGQVPPQDDGAGTWRAVRSADGHTLWRHIHLEP
jgi:hypothetical protein